MAYIIKTIESWRDRERVLAWLTRRNAMTDGRYGLQQLIARARGAAQGELNFGKLP